MFLEHFGNIILDCTNINVLLIAEMNKKGLTCRRIFLILQEVWLSMAEALNSGTFNDKKKKEENQRQRKRSHFVYQHDSGTRSVGYDSVFRHNSKKFFGQHQGKLCCIDTP